MRFRSIAAVIAMALGATAGASGTAGAHSIPWQPYHSSPFTDAPGTVCSFGLSGTIVKDEEQYRTLESYPNGKPELQEFRGPLFVRYTNTASGKSVVRDLSGYGWFRYRAEGGLDAFINKHIGVGVHAGNVGFPAGEWVLTGPSLVSKDSHGMVTVKLLHATAENICATLS